MDFSPQVANGVSFMLYLLSTNQSAQMKLREEVDTVLGQRSCTMEDLPAMPYVKAVVKETLRLFPPIPLNARVTQEEVVLSNYRIPKGVSLVLLLLLLLSLASQGHFFTTERLGVPSWLSGFCDGL